MVRIAIVSYLLKCFYSFTTAGLSDTESESKVFVEEFLWKEIDYVDSEDEVIEQLYIWEVK